MFDHEKMCNKAVNSDVHTLEFVANCFKTPKISNKAVNTYLSTIKFLPECYKTYERLYSC